MAALSRDQALSLLTAANSHGDLAVKLSYLKQAKDVLVSIDPSFAAELFPYLVEFQYSPASLVRKALVEMVEEIALNVMEHSSILIPVLVALARDDDSIVAKQAIISGKTLFSRIMEEMALRFYRYGRVERWLEDLWTWMLRFKNAVVAILLENRSIGTKLVAIKFLQNYVLLFTPDNNESEKMAAEGSRGRGSLNVLWVAGGHPVLDPVGLASEANMGLGVLLDLLRSAVNLPSLLTISVVNCLAAIARKRPLHYGTVLSALLNFDPNFEVLKGGHAASVHYSLRTAFLGFLRCMHPLIIESRDKLVRALRAMNAGDAADQAIRQVEKMMKATERASRDFRLSKDDDPIRKRSLHQENEEATTKRVRYDYNTQAAISNSSVQDHQGPANGVLLPSNKDPLLDCELTPVEQMIAVIGVFIAAGERATEQLETLIANIQPDLLADIVIANMKNLSKTPPPLTRLSVAVSATTTTTSSSTSPPATTPTTPTLSLPLSPSKAIGSSFSDTSSLSTLPPDSKRDPRKDPRRLDPRRVTASVEIPSLSFVEVAGSLQSEFDGYVSLSKSLPVSTTDVEVPSLPLLPKIKSEVKTKESPLITEQLTPKDDVLGETNDTAIPISVFNAMSDLAPPVSTLDQKSVEAKSGDLAVPNGEDSSSNIECYEHSPGVSNEETSHDLPLLPAWVDLTEDEHRSVRQLAIERIIDSYKHLKGTGCRQTRMALLARLVAQINTDDDLLVMLQKHIVSDYQHQKGHELVMHVLYHLHTLLISDPAQQASSFSVVYEKFLLAVAQALLDSFPASDKSFSRLLGEIPFLPDSALKLLEDLCCLDGKEVHDGDRVTQGLGAVWSLILGRPVNRQACLDIALKCAVHSKEEIRAKAIRLVANKLYPLNYLSEKIDRFATDMLLSTVDERLADLDQTQIGSTEQKMEAELRNQETSISGSQISEDGTSEIDFTKGAQSTFQNVPTVSMSQAQRFISLFFALCTKKPILLHLVFDVYGRAPKTVKQAIHRHIPILLRALGSTYNELLHIISDPPQGSENLLMMVLQILAEDATPTADLIATVKHLYETKLKDATVLIPMLSSLSKNEVLPIFPRLVDLPLDKFQKALAYILQGSAHTGPALTPSEVLVAIHDINPDKDGIPLKKITDACSACFEQRTVFTQQVLERALKQMVDQNPLPLLFMRTVIQAIDAFPTMVDFVMELLSKLVGKQIWRMPKLWVGFLKCISQTQPHSFNVLLQLPSQQLESALNRHATLRAPLSAHASQPNIKSSLPRGTLVVLGLANELHKQQQHLASSLHASDTSSSVQGATHT